MSDYARYSRYLDLISPERLQSSAVAVIGVGAIGRQVALALASMGVGKMTLVDPDNIEEANIGTQGYGPAQVGFGKASETATEATLRGGPSPVHTVDDRLQNIPIANLASWNGEDGSLATFCCVDSMATRRYAHRTLASRGLFIDTRMGAETARVIAVDPRMDNHDYYVSTLFPDSEALSVPCTARSTYYAALVAAGMAVAEWARWMKGERVLTDRILSLPAGEMTTIHETPAL